MYVYIYIYVFFHSMYFKGNYTDNYCGACLKGRYHKYGRPESNCRKRYGICIYRWEFTYKNLHSGRTKGSVVYWENPIGNAIIRLRVGPGCRCLISTFSKIQSVIFQLLVLLMLHWLKEHAAPFWTKQYLQHSYNMECRSGYRWYCQVKKLIL